MELTNRPTEQSSSKFPATKTTANLFDYNDVFNVLERKGKEIFSDRFRFYPDDTDIIHKLAAYFLRDREVCDFYDIDLNKGILLTGPIGCGKTSLMSLMKIIPGPEFAYHMKSCRSIAYEFIKEGFDTIHRYSKGDLYKTNLQNYCFDDLGTENNMKHFGNECNVMAEILLNRYDFFCSKNLISHVTTNLSAQEIEIYYGNRLRSRLREMLNLIAFDQNCADKRK